MKLDARLAAVASLIEEGCPLADIGTDHAYLPCYLIISGRSPFAVAADVAAGPCEAARRTVKALKLEAKVAVRQGDGLAILRDEPHLEDFYIVIAGMGGSTIAAILEKDIEVAQKARGLVLQPMAGAAGLRSFLCGRGFALIKEELVLQGEHLYEIIAAARGENCRYSPGQLLLGPLLLRDKHPLLKLQLAKQRSKLARTLAAMAQGSEAVNSPKYKYLLQLAEEAEEIEDAWYDDRS